MDKTTKIQVRRVNPPTNFFDNLSIGLKNLEGQVMMLEIVFNKPLMEDLSL